MIRKSIEVHTGPLTDPQFKDVMTLVTQDIKVNRISYGYLTPFSYANQIASITHLILSEPRILTRLEVQRKLKPIAAWN